VDYKLKLINKMKKSTIINYADGGTIRLHNKRISFKETDKKTMIRFDFADAEADKPACGHKCHRGKIRETQIQMSIEAMESLVYAYINYKRERALAKAK
jgi:hypothetical protein